jgi:hypothetical protein
MSSILNDIKHQLGLLPDQTQFDIDIIIAVNNAIATLTQLGVGPVAGYEVVDATQEWTEFIADPRLNSVKTFVYLKVKLVFDPPTTGFHTASIENQLNELVYRINTVVDYG